MRSESTVLEQVKSCGSVSCLINTEPLELLPVQPSELIASESTEPITDFGERVCMMMTTLKHINALSPGDIPF